MSSEEEAEVNREVIESLGRGVDLIYDRKTGTYLVRKEMDIYSLAVFQYLKDHHVENTPNIYEINENDGKLEVIEEYIYGQLLSDYLKQKGPLSKEESLTLIRELCLIVRDLHNCQPSLIHRDIKPDNIILSSHGNLKLLDMNAAKFFDKEGTRDTYLLGTQGYAAPEQYGFGKAGVQSDIYEIGKVLNEMLTGDINGKAEGHLGEVITKCTEIDARNRYRNIDELLKDLSSGRRTSLDYNRLPGFRTDNLLIRIAAVLGYFMIVFTCLILSVEGVSDKLLTWGYRLSYFILLVMIVLFSFNYRRIWDVFGISRMTSRILRITVIILIDIGLTVIMIMFSGWLLTSLENIRS